MARKTYDFIVLIENPLRMESIHYEVKIFHVLTGLNRRILKTYSFNGVICPVMQKESISELALYGSVLEDLRKGTEVVDEGTADTLATWFAFWTTLMTSTQRFMTRVSDDIYARPMSASNGNGGALVLDYDPSQVSRVHSHFMMYSGQAPTESVVWEGNALPETGA